MEICGTQKPVLDLKRPEQSGLFLFSWQLKAGGVSRLLKGGVVMVQFIARKFTGGYDEYHFDEKTEKEIASSAF